MIPSHITFTGIDDLTDMETVINISNNYPVEWGVLFDPTCHHNRFPSPAGITKILGADVKLAAHLCGSYARAIMRGEYNFPFDWRAFKRVQVNHRTPNTYHLQKFQDHIKLPVIGQCGTHFPLNTGIQWLFDTSGGRGVEPDSWPLSYDTMKFVGYAGGLSPANIEREVSRIDRASGRTYWLDMETGVRIDDWFSPELCKSVCIKVYGNK